MNQSILYPEDVIKAYKTHGDNFITLDFTTIKENQAKTVKYCQLKIKKENGQEVVPIIKLINLIRKSEINILIDMQGHTYDNRLQIFVEKPAPVQVSWAAYLASSGIPEIDYILGDPNVTPHDHKNLYVEKIYPNSI